MLLSVDNELKLVSRGSGSNREFFTEPASLYFGNRLRDILDDISVFITRSELDCLLNLLDWSQVNSNSIVASFLKRLRSSYNGQSIKAPCLETLLSVKDLTRVAVRQAKRIEDQARAIEASDLTLKDTQEDSNQQQESTELNFIDANRLLAVLVQLEDQVHQIVSQSECLSAEAKKILYQRDMSRAHTALGRLTSLMSLPSDK